ncbi:hypothetical protein FKM82_028621 [Ascaphus truei]
MSWLRLLVTSRCRLPAVQIWGGRIALRERAAAAFGMITALGKALTSQSVYFNTLARLKNHKMFNSTFSLNICRENEPSCQKLFFNV